MTEMDYIFKRMMNITDRKALVEGAYVVPQDTFGAIICTAGEAEVSIGEKVYRIGKHALILYVPFTVIRVLNCSEDWNVEMFEENIDFVFSSLSNVSVRKRQAVRTVSCVMATAAHYARLNQLLCIIRQREELVRENPNEEQAEILRDIVRRLAQVLCIELMEVYFECVPIEDLPLSKDAQIYNRFITSVFRHCHTERTVNFYAAEQHLSPGYFSVVVRRQSGQAALKWIEIITMSKIKQYLRRPDLSLKEIAELMNFSDQSAFGRFFRQHENGTAPSEFRKGL